MRYCNSFNGIISSLKKRDSERHVGKSSVHHHRYLLRLRHPLATAAVLLKVWSVLTSGKDHVAVPRGSEASVCCCSKLL
ncbi:unnamed protein product, partial [Vitis vinifera]